MKQLNNVAIDLTHFESLYPQDSYFKEIERIFAFIKEGNSCQLVGLPGTGRSDLLSLLSYNRNVRIKHVGDNQKWFHFVLCNFSEVKGRSLFDITKFLFLSLADSLRDRNLLEEHDAVHKIFKEHLSFNDELVLFQGLKEAITYLAIQKELTIVFLFNRFETYIPTLTSLFFDNLRVLRDIAKYRFSLVVSLSRPLDDLIDPSLLSDFYEFLTNHIVYMPLMDKPTLDFRISYLEKSTEKKIDPKITDAIVKITGGHGKLTRLGLEEAINATVASKNNTEEVLLSQKPIRNSLAEIWNSLTPSEQNILATSYSENDYLMLHTVILGSVATPESNQEDSGQVFRPRAQDREARMTNLHKVSDYLERIGLIKDGKIMIPLFAKYLKEQTIEKKEQDDHIIYNDRTREITKGGLRLSDVLTSAEYRLLRFLLQHKGQIVERDEIIQVVWQGNQTTEGVTDQALDQLIFRLRKKIETNPNNPLHIQTVKGRGFRFVS